MTPVEVVLGQVLLGVAHTADAEPQVKRTFPRGGEFSAFSRWFCGTLVLTAV